jgi:long-subunit fatty acid transport protein
MTTMKTYLFTLLLSIFFISVSGQTAGYADTLAPAAGNETELSHKPWLRPFDEGKKISVRMEMGSSFGLGSGSDGLFGVYIAPHIRYQVNPRLSVNFGAIVQNTNFINYYNPYNPYFPEYTQTFGSRINRTLLYAEGNYMATPRLMINAKVYKEVSVFDEPVMNPRALTPDGEGVSVGFNYLINEHTSIGASFGYSRGNNAYSPFYQPGSGAFFGNPFDTGRQGSYFGRPGW